MKQKKCKQCREPFTPIKPVQSRCVPCTIAKARVDFKLVQERQRKSKLRQMKEGLKTVSDYRNDLQVEINKIVRLIDKECKCISCGAVTDKVDAGHYRSVGGHAALRFHLSNNYLQCKQCNNDRHGNGSDYVDGIIATFGRDMFDYIVDLKVQYPHLKLSAFEIREAIKVARSIVNELIKLNLTDHLPRGSADRIRLRMEYNKDLNLYQ